MTSYEEQYGRTSDLFGSGPEEILRERASLIDRHGAVLDVGAGQGRNTLFLARKGFRVDAIDPSSVAIETIKEAVQVEQLSVEPRVCSFDVFAPEVDSYSAIMIFGLIQILSWDQIGLLIRFVDRWLGPAGLVFVTGFTTEDESLARYARDWTSMGRNSFSDEKGSTRTYLLPEELLTLFSGYQTLHFWEGPGAEHRHGDGPTQRHAMVEAVFRR